MKASQSSQSINPPKSWFRQLLSKERNDEKVLRFALDKLAGDDDQGTKADNQKKNN